MSGANASFPYEEPAVITILIYSSFLLLLNIVNFILDKTIYCGLLGQLFIGVAYGTPGAKWLHPEAETVITDLGYLGLILLVYEGGLSTSIISLRANLFLSIGVALTGIGLPIGLSFVLRALTNATPLQAFSAGAALCSTSLGTTFTVLQSSGLTTSRLGVVLTSAAMMDDVVGLVMVQVISELGSSFTAPTVVRPVFVSIGVAVMVPVFCWLIIKPATSRYQAWSKKQNASVQKLLSQPGTPLIVHLLLLFGMVAAGSFAGTSNLFTAYLTGVSITWWDGLHIAPKDTAVATRSTSNTERTTTKASSSSNVSPKAHSARNNDSALTSSGVAVYEHYLKQAVNRILKPLFFASVGFSIPISRMFAAKVVWRGIIYTILMSLGKLACGFWLIRISITQPASFSALPTRLSKLRSELRSCFDTRLGPRSGTLGPPSTVNVQLRQLSRRKSGTKPEATTPRGMVSSKTHQGSIPTSSTPVAQQRSVSTGKATSLYPAAIVGSAMVARGEIGFLISSLAQSRGIFDAGVGDVFLVVTWAIMLCTILGPLAVGLLVRRVRMLEQRSQTQAGHEGQRDVLGVWGVG